ncbi:hypothetical protein LX36DRAFT_289592 [Colletotrichum falcatum]|nr:hypothetical protein LX36DRAFT_289592 [Colletotrichum falcatum]
MLLERLHPAPPEVRFWMDVERHKKRRGRAEFGRHVVAGTEYTYDVRKGGGGGGSNVCLLLLAASQHVSVRDSIGICTAWVADFAPRPFVPVRPSRPSVDGHAKQAFVHPLANTRRRRAVERRPADSGPGERQPCGHDVAVQTIPELRPGERTWTAAMG